MGGALFFRGLPFCGLPRSHSRAPDLACVCEGTAGKLEALMLQAANEKEHADAPGR